MHSTARLLVTLLLASTPLLPALAQLPAGMTPPTPTELSTRVDSIVNNEVLTRGFPSVSIAITRAGKPLLERAYGVADVATGQKADAHTIYRIGSITKQFTAALVLKLVERNKLALTDSIGRYLTGLRPEWNAITVEQLLNHTAGLPRDFLDLTRVTEQLTADQLIAMAARDSLVTRPGTTFAYSNTGYLLLGALVEKVYGKPYASVLRDEIAKPLGLTSTSVCDDKPTGRAATGYHRLSDGKTAPANYQHISQALGAGSICATASDVAKWNYALHNGRVLSAASYTAMTTPRGAATSYGFGLGIRKSPWGSPSVIHDGIGGGFSAQNGWYPAESLSVTLLFNARPYIEAPMQNFIGLLALGGTPPRIPKPTPVELPVAATQDPSRPKFVGAYELSAGAVFIVTFEEGSLHVTPPNGGKQPLFLKSGTTYVLGKPDGTTIVTFIADASGVTGFTVKQPTGPERELRKVK